MHQTVAFNLISISVALVAVILGGLVAAGQLDENDSGLAFVTTGSPANSPLNNSMNDVKTFVSTYCLDCHSTGSPERDFDLEVFDFSSDQVSAKKFNYGGWEKMLRRIDARQMPPPSADRPSEEEFKNITKAIGEVLDRRSSLAPNPGRTGAVRRLTRTEYQNVIRDLVGIKIDATEFLPKDQSSHGFDNITVEELSPTLLNRYVTAAQKISRAAVGAGGGGPTGVTIRIPADRTQENHVQGLPFGTRGGTVFEFLATQTADYEFEIKLTRDRDEKVEGLHRKHQLDLLVDRKRTKQFTVTPPPGKGDYERDFTHVDSHLKAKIHLTAGVHEIGVTFPKTFSSIPETKRQPFDASYNRHRHPRRAPAIFQVAVVGPFDQTATEETESRQLIFGESNGKSRENAKLILARVARLAYRRPVDNEDMDTPMRFFDESFNADRDFDLAIESALSSILVNPNMLLRVERQPDSEGAKGPYRISDFELASRLAFFLWSSIPDDELLRTAENGTLHQDDVLMQQVNRMLKDPKSEALVSNFAAQWLYLKNLESITPDLRRFPDFDDNLRQAFRSETEFLFRDIMRNDQSVLGLIKTDHTFLNERLAKHYEIPGVLGSHFRRFDLPPNTKRGGILRHGSILMVTSYATRTSPTIRGSWILENIIGTPPPPPPANVTDLKENTALDATSIRERLAQHRADPACASCHDIMDPVGFSLENFDAVGRWRDLDGEFEVDAQGELPDGTIVESLEDLESGIVARPELFVRTMTEKMFTYSLGRSVEPFDGPAIRKIVQQSSESDYKFSSIVSAIVLSKPFRMRSSEQ
jgi:hypothetical protein